MNDENIGTELVTVSKEYLKKLEDLADTSSWQRGYISGVDDGIAFAERILQALQTERSE